MAFGVSYWKFQWLTATPNHHKMKVRINLQNLITPSIFVMILLFVTNISLWITFYFLKHPVEPLTGYVGSNAESFIPANSFWAHLITLVLSLIMVVLIVQANNRYAYINTRTFIHTFLYLLISAFWIEMHGNYIGYFAALCVFLSIYLYFSMYGNNKATEASFLGTMFLSISVFILPQYIIFLPLVWIGFYQIRSLSFRTFFASVFGFIVPWIFIFLFFYLQTDQLVLTPDFSVFFKQIYLISFDASPRNIYAALLLLILFILLFASYKQLNRESVKTRKLLLFFKIIGFGLLTLMVLFPDDMLSYQPLVISLYAIISAYTFTYRRTNFYSILFILLCIFSAAYILFQLYI